ncbi:MAG: hypothetical protein VKM34_01820 [Cyanobacteriota bacterium]|nr:hypothetical protein [Cyanobacteriota bacterium]
MQLLLLMGKAFRSNILLSGAIVASVVTSALPGSAALFVVNKNFWGNHSTEGTFSWAINQTNITPGKDIIELTTNVSIDDFFGGSAAGVYAATFTDPDGVDIFGAGHRLTGNPSFININGTVRTKYDPDAFRPGDILTLQANSFARVANNVNSIYIDALRVDGLNQFLEIGQGSTVTVRNSVFDYMTAFGKPQEPVFRSQDDSTLNLLGVTMKHINRFRDPTDGFEWAWASVIEGLNANLNIDKSTLSLYTSQTAGAVNWIGGTANIVSSVILGKGLSIMDYTRQGVLNIVNSLFRPLGRSETARIQASNNGVANLIASTIQFDASDTSNLPGSGSLLSCPTNYKCNGAPLQAFNGGTINLLSSAVSVLGIEDARIANPYSNTYDGLAGALTADVLSYVQPVAGQDAAALKSLFNQPNLLTAGVPFAVDTSDPYNFLHYFELPDGGAPLAPGPLVDVIADADGANQLINPIDGSVITRDVFHHPRTTNGFRNIGAVQATVQTPVPGPLPVLGISAVLAWSRRLRHRRHQPSSLPRSQA